MSKTHNKLKNTGLIFELLGKAVVMEALHRDRLNALTIVKRHFKRDSELLKELNLYTALNNRTGNDPMELIELSARAWQKLDHKKLDSEKYNLVKDIKKVYDLNEFFKPRSDRYKLSASIYKVFNQNGQNTDPDGYLTARNYISEHICGKTPESEKTESERLWENEDRNTRKLGFKILVKKFNEKYQALSDRQKLIISKYITEGVTSDKFKAFVVKELDYIKVKLSEKSISIENEPLRTKINESISMLPTIASARILKDDHLSALLKFHDLLEELG
jgi:hypothetical protein